MSTAEVRELALELPEEDRARLARELIASLDADVPDPGIEDAWIEEIEARAEALDRGDATAFDGQASLDKVRQQLRQGRPM
jgi:putative addiction module component (TIGR02574 family)